MENDSVDIILQQWRRERPDLDPEPMGIIGRLSRVAQHVGQQIERELQTFGLGRGEFDVLATLRRAGAPYQLTPTALFRSLMLSSGAMTNRIDRLEQAGWVRRCPDPTDRRGTLIQLTSEGVDRVNRAVEAHLENERRLLATLSAEEKVQIRDVLRHMLASFETPEQDEKP
ncbi:MAG: MarR family transcriptional regulator [Roseiflexaceae bacterium]|nr:MarR family transcriptional regulator [Roseiflexaceae bacterium]